MDFTAVAWPDLVAPAFFVACWAGYSRWADDGAGYPRSLMARADELRIAWMGRMLGRDVRIVDVQVVQVLVQAIAFFASSAVLIVGGCLAVLGARDQAMAIVDQIPFAAHSPPVVWEAKMLLLAGVFVYAFFKFTWALRQYNYVTTIIGAAPPYTENGTPAAAQFALRAGSFANRAASNFNKAMRSYYFGIAALAWLVHPFLLMLTTAAVVLIVYRREFQSRSVAALTGLVWET
jgi:uncharacterized membrane protein